MWLDDPNVIPLSVSLPLQKETYRGEVARSYFNNLLPDSEPLLRKIAERVSADGIGAYSLLSKIGRDCVGALEFRSSSDDALFVQGSAAQPYVVMSEQEVHDILASLSRSPLGIAHDGGFRISLAGAQEKAAFLMQDGHWCRPVGTMPTTHIFKPQIGELDFDGVPVDFSQSVENEFYCLNLLQSFGLKCAQVSMADFKGKRVLIVERFDRRRRSDGSILRLPQEDTCQALGVPPTQKYQSYGGPKLIDILKLLEKSDTPIEDQETVFMAQILFWLIGAPDGHAKNFSIFLRPQGQLQLTPLYDVLSAEPAFQDNKIRHRAYRLAMSVGRKPHYKILEVHGRHFVETAVAAGLSERFAGNCIRTVQGRFDEAFDHVVKALPDDFPMHIHESIKAGAKERLLKLQTAFE
jgi:serine/threonine-protein kinase HipA